MGRLFDPDAYALGWLGAPYLVAAFGLAAWFAFVLFHRGNPVVRTSLLCAVGLGVVWAAYQGFGGTAPDADAALRMHRLSIATISVIGAATFAVLLSMRDRLHHHRLLLALAIASSVASAVTCVSTDLVVRDVWRTSWGYWYLRAGDLNGLHLGMFVGWALLGAVLGMRAVGRTSARAKQRSRRVVIVAVLMLLGSVDALLAHGIGVYSIAWLTGILVAVGGLIGLRHDDVLRVRGRDHATAPELALMLVLAAVVYALFYFTRGAGATGVSVLAIVLVVPLLGIAQVGVGALRASLNRDTTSGQLDRAVDELVDVLSEVRGEDGLVEALSGVLEEQMQLTESRLLAAEEDGTFVLVDPDADDEAAPVRFRIDARVRAWLLANRTPLIAERLAAQRLGGLRAPIGDLMDALSAAVVLPLVDRDELIGFVVAGESESDRAITDMEVEALTAVQDAIARALTYMTLYRAAQERVEVAREVEVAAAVHHRREAGERRVVLDHCEIVAHYQPAGQFGGDWWSSAELVDGRVLVMVGDVSGQGVPAALVTATIEGCCETALSLLGAGFDVYDLLQLMNQSVLDVGGSRYLMSCWAGVFDPNEMTMTFANAGHPFPYVCREAERDRRGAKLTALVSKGTPLGIERDPVISVSMEPVRAGDVVVMYTDALVESENAEGVRYGDRRLQRAIRRRLPGSGADMCQRLIDDALGYFGERPLREDVTLVCLRIGRPAKPDSARAGAKILT